MSETIKLSPPWITYYRELVALFGEDPDIRIEYDEDQNEVKLFVNGNEKADALTQLLPVEKEFGNVILYITVIPANNEMKKIDIYRKAFEGNPVYSYAASVEGIMTNSVNYIIFKNQVCQYWTDNLGDINGNKSDLYENIARDVFEDKEGIFFCTDLPSNLGKPNNVYE